MNKIKQWFHDVLDWGFPNGKYNKWSNSGCQFCEKCIEQDSTGSWFHLSSKWNKKKYRKAE